MWICIAHRCKHVGTDVR